MEDQSIKGTVYFNLEVEESSLNFLKGVGLLRCGAVTARGVFFFVVLFFKGLADDLNFIQHNEVVQK